ncbi:DUF7453 family protein, partial [Iningainema tapete]
MNTYIHNIRSQRRLINFAVENSHQNAKLGEKWKRRLQNWSGGVTLSLCLSALAATQVQAATYSFTKIADTKSFPWRSISTAVINDSGTVSFLVTSTRETRNISGYSILYTSNENQLTEIANSDTVSSLFGNSTLSFSIDLLEGINNNGTVAFKVEGGMRRGIFISQNGFATGRGFGGTSPGGTIDISQASLNDLEELVYLEKNITRTDSVILTRPNQPNVTIATASIPFPPGTPPAINARFIGISSVDINNNSEVVFAATNRDGTAAIYTNRGDSLSTLVEIGADRLDINDSGDVALSNQNTISLFHRASGSLSAIADTSGQFRIFGFPAINNNGKLAFGATLALGETGIYTGADPVNDKVIASGDTLLGSTVKSVRFSRQGLNNQGQIVFLAE